MMSLLDFAGKDVEIRSRGTMSIEYCPDNTCDGFVGSTRGATIENLADFAHIYLFYVSRYVYLEDARLKPNARALVIEALQRHTDGCPSSPELAAARCVLEKISEEDDVRVVSVRFDENTRTENVVDLRAALDAIGRDPSPP